MNEELLCTVFIIFSNFLYSFYLWELNCISRERVSSKILVVGVISIYSQKSHFRESAAAVPPGTVRVKYAFAKQSARIPLNVTGYIDYQHVFPDVALFHFHAAEPPGNTGRGAAPDIHVTGGIPAPDAHVPEFRKGKDLQQL